MPSRSHAERLMLRPYDPVVESNESMATEFTNTMYNAGIEFKILYFFNWLTSPSLSKIDRESLRRQDLQLNKTQLEGEEVARHVHSCAEKSAEALRTLQEQEHSAAKNVLRATKTVEKTTETLEKVSLENTVMLKSLNTDIERHEALVDKIRSLSEQLTLQSDELENKTGTIETLLSTVEAFQTGEATHAVTLQTTQAQITELATLTLNQASTIKMLQEQQEALQIHHANAIETCKLLSQSESSLTAIIQNQAKTIELLQMQREKHTTEFELLSKTSAKLVTYSQGQAASIERLQKINLQLRARLNEQTNQEKDLPSETQNMNHSNNLEFFRKFK